MKTKLSDQQILEKISQGQFDFRDSDGNNLLHLLLMQEANKRLSLDVVKSLLKKSPNLINQPNNKGMLPVQILEVVQPEQCVSNRPLRRLLLQYLKPGLVKDQLTRTAYMSFWEQYTCDQGKLRDNSHLLPVHADLFNKPSLLFFSGWRTDNSRFLLGVARSFRKSLRLWRTPTPEIQMLFAQYPGNQQDLANDCEQIQHPKATLLSDHPIHYVRAFVAEYLRPLYAPEGKRLPCLKAMKNIRVVNFVGYSYGASVIQMIADAMKLDMKKYHFTEQEIRKIQSQIPAFLIAPYLNPKHTLNDFQSYYFVNAKDTFIYKLIQSALNKKIPESSEYFCTTLQGNKNQKVIIVNDDCKEFMKKLTLRGASYDVEEDLITPHDVRCYFQTENTPLRRVNAWKNRIVFNMLRNTKQNQVSSTLVPLGNLEGRSCVRPSVKSR